jgi:alpha-tubulin suppressor-like RCC1 family protein
MGNNFDGQLGSGNLKRYSSPNPIVGDLRWAQISSGDWHSCGMTETNDAYCWGYNGDGRCGIGSKKTPILTPTPVAGNYKWKMISAGYFYSCGVRRDGAAFCWGKDNYGRIGSGVIDRSNYTTPHRVGTDTDWVQVFAGGDHTCGLKTDKTVWCWGNNEDGQLGVGKSPKDLPASATPIKVKGTYKYLSNSSKFACAIQTDGVGVCWGSNAWGNLGTGKNGSYAISPVKIKSGGLWRQVVAGQFVGCGIKSDNTGWCWGAGYLSPIKFKPDGWISITAGDWSASGVNANGTAYSWWENEWGEGGVGKPGYLKTPTEVVGGAKWGPPAMNGK